MAELRETHWLREQVHVDGTPICKPRHTFTQAGLALIFSEDRDTQDKIEASGLDPRDSEFWERHPASDGNKGYRTWRGKRHELGD